MVRCGLALGLDGRWSVEQLSEELQAIVKDYPTAFNGTSGQESEMSAQQAVLDSDASKCSSLEGDSESD
jgi:hypothetical protein